MIIWMSVVATGLLALAVLKMLFSQKQQITTLQKQLAGMAKDYEEIKRDHPALVTADLFFAKQLRELTSQLVSMDNQLQSFSTMRENDGGYQHALHILAMGGSKNEIVDSCHLSNAEAELLMNLQAYRAALK